MTDKEFRLHQNRLQLKEVGGHAINWLIQVGKRYKESGVFPLSLTDYYSDHEDIEVAAILEFAVPENSPRRNDYITEIHNLIGPHPGVMARERSFLFLNDRNGLGSRLILRCRTITKDELFNLFDWCWRVYRQGMTIETAVTKMRNPFQTIPNIFQIEEKMKLLMMRMVATDGIGKGLWKDITGGYLSCPMFKRNFDTLRIFYPIERIDVSMADEILDWLGFSPPSEFAYACWGLEELKKGEHGDQIRRFERNFPKRWQTGLAQMQASPSGTTRNKTFASDLPNLF